MMGPSVWPLGRPLRLTRGGSASSGGIIGSSGGVGIRGCLGGLGGFVGARGRFSVGIVVNWKDEPETDREGETF